MICSGKDSERIDINRMGQQCYSGDFRGVVELHYFQKVKQDTLIVECPITKDRIVDINIFGSEYGINFFKDADTRIIAYKYFNYNDWPENKFIKHILKKWNLEEINKAAKRWDRNGWNYLKCDSVKYYRLIISSGKIKHVDSLVTSVLTPYGIRFFTF